MIAMLIVIGCACRPTASVEEYDVKPFANDPSLRDDWREAVARTEENPTRDDEGEDKDDADEIAQRIRWSERVVKHLEPKARALSSHAVDGDGLAIARANWFGDGGRIELSLTSGSTAEKSVGRRLAPAVGYALATLVTRERAEATATLINTGASAIDIELYLGVIARADMNGRR